MLNQIEPKEPISNATCLAELPNLFSIHATSNSKLTQLHHPYFIIITLLHLRSLVIVALSLYSRLRIFQNLSTLLYLIYTISPTCFPFVH
jgi:hypothetical protein